MPVDATLTVLPLSFSQRAELPWVPTASVRDVKDVKGSVLEFSFGCDCKGPAECAALSEDTSKSSCEEDANKALSSGVILKMLGTRILTPLND